MGSVINKDTGGETARGQRTGETQRKQEKNEDSESTRY